MCTFLCAYMDFKGKHAHHSNNREINFMHTVEVLEVGNKSWNIPEKILILWRLVHY